ncbi:thioredoxin family protein [Tellurirhabdus bombi]|uniref:thioredoxin family protein n=1 Tax=Tellurirhabdus bombi TaxID=2907205 RepID=UPI001F309586|nr:DUF255 domain-containing protein [Tellurirhabdus bombi]
MKKLPFLLGLCLAFLSSYADEPVGVRFFTGPWKDVLAEAKRQNKPIFIDIYTTWCGPCKLMSKEAFPDPKVAEKFNAGFVSYKIDAEKGEGIGLAKKYNVEGYPTSLFVSANGDLIYRTLGYGGVKKMLEEADKALEAAKDPKPIAVWEKEYNSGKRDATFLAGYLAKRSKAGLPSGPILDEYLKTVPEGELTTLDNLTIMAGTVASTRSKAFTVLQEQMPKLKSSPIGTMALRNMQTAVYNDLKQAAENKDEQQLEEVIAQNKKLVVHFRPMTPEAVDEMANEHRMNFYLKTKDTEKFSALASTYADGKLMTQSVDELRKKDAANYQRFEDDMAKRPEAEKKGENFERLKAFMKSAESGQVANKLNSLAWNYYNGVTDPKQLNQALAWSKRSLDLDAKPAFMDTYAHLLHKLGKKAEATKVQEEAIAKAKAIGEDSTQLEEELTKMKSGK